MTKESMIKEIQLLRNKNMSYQKIADNLNQRKIKTISGRGKWGKGSIGRLLSKAKDALYTQDTKDNSQIKHQKDHLFKELNKDKQANIDLSNQLNKVKQAKESLINLKNQNNSLLNELNKAKQTNADLLNQLNKVKHQNNLLIEVKHQNEELSKELNKVKQVKDELCEKLNKVKHDKKEKSKKRVKMSIDGWSVQKSGGYYRLFRKIAGKVHGIYIGKTINEDIAKNKIITYMQGFN